MGDFSRRLVLIASLCFSMYSRLFFRAKENDFGLSLHLRPWLVCASGECPGESVSLHRLMHSLLTYEISTKSFLPFLENK